MLTHTLKYSTVDREETPCGDPFINGLRKYGPFCFVASGTPLSVRLPLWELRVSPDAAAVTKLSFKVRHSIYKSYALFG